MLTGQLPSRLPDDNLPNLVIVVADQERWDVLGSYGSPICRTPNLDSLAAAGVRFETCLAPTAICSPARASLLTGLFPHGHGILNNTHEADAIRTELPAELATYPELLRDAGYRLGYVGKWHVGRLGPESRGFHDVVAHADVSASTGEEAIVIEEPSVDEPVFARYPRGRLLVAGIDRRPAGETETRRDVDAAIDLLERYAKLDTPFCLRLDLEGPHHPYTPPEPFASMYDPASIPPWPSFDEDTTTKPAAQHRLLEQRGVAGWTWANWAPVVGRYFGFVSFIDSEIARVVEAIDRFALADDTVVIHTADHGDMTGTHGGQFNKGPLGYDEIYRVPLLIRGPGVAAGGVCRTPISSAALMPTILELAGLTPPPGLHVGSLVPLLREPNVAPDDASVFAEYHGEEWGLYSQRLVRTATAKYVYSPHGTDELYDLASDPHETVNRIDEPAMGVMRTNLRARLLEWMVKTNDPLALWAGRLL
jgi:arylsulfatase A-like enzyme